MRRFTALLETEIDFVSEDEAEQSALRYQDELAMALRAAAENISLRTISENKVVHVHVAESGFAAPE